ncbi:MAG: hypothetical protein OJJ54_03505 [Pseudonocardia sp.]|nr:hypothetical protein [Pseudonocardia sp.]
MPQCCGDLVFVEVVQGAVEESDEQVDPDLVERAGVPGALDVSGQPVDAFHGGVGGFRGESVGGEGGGAVLGDCSGEVAFGVGFAEAPFVVRRIGFHDQPAEVSGDLGGGPARGAGEDEPAQVRDLVLR